VSNVQRSILGSLLLNNRNKELGARSFQLILLSPHLAITSKTGKELSRVEDGCCLDLLNQVILNVTLG